MEDNNFLTGAKKFIGIVQIKRNTKIDKYTGFLISKNVILTSCHCVTPDMKNIPPDEIMFILQDKEIKIKDVYRFQNYECINDCIKKLNSLFPKKFELLKTKIREKVKHNLDFALLNIDSVAFDDNLFKTLIINADYSIKSEFTLIGLKDGKIDRYDLNNLTEENEENVISFKSLESDSLRGSPIFIKNSGKFFLYALNTSSQKINRQQGVKLKKFISEINFNKSKYIIN